MIFIYSLIFVLCITTATIYAASSQPNKISVLPNLLTPNSKTLETQYTGYLSTSINTLVNTTTPSTELFFWLQESRSNPDKDPVLLWLQVCKHYIHSLSNYQSACIFTCY